MVETDTSRCLVCQELFIKDENRLIIKLNEQDYAVCVEHALEWNQKALEALKGMMLRRGEHEKKLNDLWTSKRVPWQRMVLWLLAISFVAGFVWVLFYG